MAGARTGLWLTAIGRTLTRQVRAEWSATPMGRATLGRPKASGFRAAPRDPRPLDPARGRALSEGVFTLGGESLAVGPDGDPWNRPSPSQAFAARLHGFDWLGDLVAVGEPGARQGLKLVFDWKRVFGAWNGFSWGPDILERRVFNLACLGQTLSAAASEWEQGQLADSLARQARHLIQIGDEPPRAAERLAACALAGLALDGAAGDRLVARALPRLDAALAEAVLPDGGHASRSPQAGLDLLLDLLALDEALTQSGRAPLERLSRSIDRLTAGVRFFTQPDGRLSAFQGGEPGEARTVAAALAHDANGGRASPLADAPFSGYQRLGGAGLTVMVDAGPPAAGAWSVAACGQPGAIEVLCGRDRLIANCGWSPRAQGPDWLRLTMGGSTVSLDQGMVGAPLTGYLARALGPRLDGAPAEVKSQRRENESGVWLEVSHEGWLATTGLIHERRLFLDKARGELRGEDRFVPGPAAPARPVVVAVRFHLPPEVHALVSRDQRSVLLRGRSNVGWWLRSDASETVIDPSVSFHDGVAQGANQIVLRGRLRADRGGRVRWKLALAEAAPAGAPPPTPASGG